MYQTMDDVRLEFDHDAEPSTYRRELDLNTGVATVRYAANDIRYLREVFASAPGRSIVVRLTADKPGSISFRATLTRPADAQSEAGGDRLVLTGQAFPRGRRASLKRASGSEPT
jgi:alpha-L-fucosidase 2